jgi:antiviral helicase SKI2
MHTQFTLPGGPYHILTQALTSTQYNMILNLLRIEAISVEAMIQRSFSEFATQRALTANDYPQLLSKGLKTLSKLDEAAKSEGSIVGAEDIHDYFKTSQDLLSSHREVFDYLLATEGNVFEEDVFVPGRSILVSSARRLDVVRAPAIILRSTANSTGAGSKLPEGGVLAEHEIVCLILLPSASMPDSSDEPNRKPGTIGYVGKTKHRAYSIRKVKLDHILAVLTRKQKIEVKDLLKEEESSRMSHPGMRSGAFAVPAKRRDDPFAGMASLGKKGGTVASPKAATSSEDSLSNVVDGLIEVEQLEIQGDGAPLLDLKPFLQRGNDVFHFRGVCETIELLCCQLRSFSAHRHPRLEKYYREIEKRETLRTKVSALQHALSNESLALFPDFVQRKRVLSRLGYIDSTETVRVKGRVACEVNTAESLIATELVFEGVLNDLKPEEIAACLSAMVFQEKGESELDSELPEALVECCRKMQAIATNLGQIQKECGLKVDPNEYRDNSFKFGLVRVVYDWALGHSFKDICELTDVQEGSIVRAISRLDELCREIRNCARAVGNPTLYGKMESVMEMIRRDIVFASSLYVN